jgi:hypothetical protein
MDGSIEISEIIKELPSKNPSLVDNPNQLNNDKMIIKIDNNDRFKPIKNKKVEGAEENKFPYQSHTPKRKINPKNIKNIHRHVPKNGEYFWTILNADSYRNQVIYSNICRK